MRETQISNRIVQRMQEDLRYAIGWISGHQHSSLHPHLHDLLHRLLQNQVPS